MLELQQHSDGDIQEVYEAANEEKRRLVALIDADIIAYEFGNCKDEDGNLSEWSYVQGRVEERIRGIMEKTRADGMKLYLSNSDKNFRKEIATILPYKGQRTSEKPHYWKQIRDFLLNHRGAILVDWIEADDAVSIEQMDSDKDYDTVICSVDKDLNMIPGWHYNWRKDNLYWVDEITGIRSFYKQLLTGDKVDNILGLYGVGNKSKYLVHIDNLEDEKDMYQFVKERYFDRFGQYWYIFFNENAKLLWMLRDKSAVGARSMHLFDSDNHLAPFSLQIIERFEWLEELVEDDTTKEFA